MAGLCGRRASPPPPARPCDARRGRARPTDGGDRAGVAALRAGGAARGDGRVRAASRSAARGTGRRRGPRRSTSGARPRPWPIDRQTGADVNCRRPRHRAVRVRAAATATGGGGAVSGSGAPCRPGTGRRCAARARRMRAPARRAAARPPRPGRRRIVSLRCGGGAGPSRAWNGYGAARAPGKAPLRLGAVSSTRLAPARRRAAVGRPSSDPTRPAPPRRRPRRRRPCACAFAGRAVAPDLGSTTNALHPHTRAARASPWSCALSLRVPSNPRRHRRRDRRTGARVRKSLSFALSQAAM